MIARQPERQMKVPRPGFAAQSNDVFSQEKMFDVFPQSIPYPFRLLLKMKRKEL
jgi:hypothetical protein